MNRQTDQTRSRQRQSQSSLTIQTKWVVLASILLVLVGLVSLGLALAPNARPSSNASSDDIDAFLTQEMLRIGDELQCPICEGQSVAFSNSQLAAEMRRQIMEHLQAGADEAEIKRYFVDRYGEVVLREPLQAGLNLWLWRMPMIGLVVGLIVLSWALVQTTRIRQVNQRESVAQSVKSAAEIDPEVQSLLSQYDKELLG